MVQKLAPDFLFSNTQYPLKNQVVIVDEYGTIRAVERQSQHDISSCRLLKGALVPGFVNAHCHLELSHMKGKIPTGTGLVKFIEGVVTQRNASDEEILEAINDADEEMQRAGIVAVGDICNQKDTFIRKELSPIFYYSFVEMFDFCQNSRANQYFDSYKKVYDALEESEGHRKSAVPHAPYSVSPGLFRLINQLNQQPGTISIHNQETEAENQLFLDGKGAFVDLFRQFGFDYDEFEATSCSSIHYALSHLDPRHRHLFVHNTLTNEQDIAAAEDWNSHCYWVSCPNANLYIENRLPNYRLFLESGAKVCLGTDSLTSNWQLSIFEEMKTISRYQSYVPFNELVRWATLNGALALGIDARYGSIAPGKNPGLNLITLDESGNLNDGSTVEKIF